VLDGVRGQRQHAYVQTSDAYDMEVVADLMKAVR
jgi:hypothetical protein